MLATGISAHHNLTDLSLLDAISGAFQKSEYPSLLGPSKKRRRQQVSSSGGVFIRIAVLRIIRNVTRKQLRWRSSKTGVVLLSRVTEAGV